MGTGNRVLSGAIALVGAVWLVLALPPAPAAAEPLWGFEPSIAKVGEVVTISGTGWTSGQGDVWIFLPGVRASGDSSTYWKAARVLPDGTFRIDGVEVPHIAGGLQQRFFACQLCASIGEADPPPNGPAYLDIPADLHFDEAEGLPETVLQAFGSGWKPGDGPVTVFATEAESDNPDNQLVSYELQANGTLMADSTFEVRGYDAKSYTFFACQVCGDEEKIWSADVPFRVTAGPQETFDPSLELEVKKAMVAQAVGVEGHGWDDAAGDVFVYSDVPGVDDERSLRAQAEVEGGAFGTSITVPETEAEALTILACQACGKRPDLVATKPLAVVLSTKVVPRLNLRTSSGSPGSEVQATGTGWGTGDVQLYARRGSAEQKPLGSAPTTNGSFGATLTVPDMDVGPIDVVACQQCGTTDPVEVVESFTVVKAKQDGPSLTVRPRAVKSGEQVRVTGAGWSPDDGEVAVYLEQVGTNERTEWFSATSDPDRTFVREVDAPDRDTGNYRVVACQHCDEAPGNPQATRALAINGDGGPNLLLVALVLAGAFVVWRRVRGPGPDDDRDGTAAGEGPVVHAHADTTFEVQLREREGEAVDVEVPSLDVVAHPDPARLADQLEVRT